MHGIARSAQTVTQNVSIMKLSDHPYILGVLIMTAICTLFQLVAFVCINCVLGNGPDVVLVPVAIALVLHAPCLILIPLLNASPLWILFASSFAGIIDVSVYRIIRKAIRKLTIRSTLPCNAGASHGA